jgi:Domain of unknown function (DUF5122) beta-propeller
VQVTSDGDYVIAGSTNSLGTSADVLLAKFNGNSSLVWIKTLGGIGYDSGTALQVTSDGGYIVTGFTNSGTSFSDGLLAKFGMDGNLTWAKTFGGTVGNIGSRVAALQITSDNGYIVAGATDSFGVGGSDVLLAKFNMDGNLTWAKTLGGLNNDAGTALQVTSDGGYILVLQTALERVVLMSCWLNLIRMAALPGLQRSVVQMVTPFLHCK